MSKSNIKRGVWLLTPDPSDTDKPPALIGEASNWDEALIVFADWCHRTEVKNLSDDDLQCNGMAVRAKCMDRFANRFGLDEFPALTAEWSFTMNKVCPGYCFNPLALEISDD